MCATLFQKNGILSLTHCANAANLITHDYHLIKGSTLDKLASTEKLSMFILKIQNKSSANTYLENVFNDNEIDWTAI